MPQHEPDPKPDTKPESGAQARRGTEPRSADETEADSRLAVDRGAGSQTGDPGLPLTEIEPPPASGSATEPDAGRTGAAGESPSPLNSGNSDLLAAAMRRWEETQRHNPDPSPKSFGIDKVPFLDEFHRGIRKGKPEPPPPGAMIPSAAATRDNQARPADMDITRAQDALDVAPARTVRRADPVLIGRYRLIRIIGEGGYGRVFLAHDPDLDRNVAIKVPIHVDSSKLLDVERYLREARVLARLSHPNIVPVYDVGRTQDENCFVVSKYMDGGDLAARISHCRLGFADSAGLVSLLCDALHYTHTQDMFHRDIKPANILLDSAGVPYLADFGLVLRDENLGRGEEIVGTAAYMSPEQARGEGHRVDGRSDIFSMGIVLFELLTGRRPFRGGNHLEVMKQIINTEPRPPRQIDDTIPWDLERICMKALSKRAAERYSTARDLAEELRHYLKSATWAVANPDASSKSGFPTSASLSGQWDTTTRPIRIVPKGLAAFDENDAEFFLGLLPGPRGRDGLPDGLRLWRTRIESTDTDKTFRVGLIYGPSGCGKSSLVKAGLIPLLGRHVASIYVESSTLETESRLLRGIRKRFPSLPVDTGLVGSLTLLRQGHGLENGYKLLLVLDQFEQWLCAQKGDEGTELIAALRQCDGEHVQALCLVRDDFWMAANRFMTHLEIDLVSDRNVAAIDLFDPKHARKVLEACGRAYEVLPPTGDLTKEQNTFLDQAVTGLAQDGRVVPVRLALFAEMVKGKPWSPATLRDLGGMDGVGVKFLEDTFSSSRSNPKHHYHQKATQAILKSLLPDTNTDIKGRMRSIDDLRRVSGYAERPVDFVELIKILDNDLRLITPVDPEGSIHDEPRSLPSGEGSYQLTHDYLVHSMRDWLTCKQKETRRGRAEIRLGTITSYWRDRPGTRRLPALLEWLDIVCYTQSRLWSESERRMMRAATRHYAIRAVAAAAVVVVLSVAIKEYRGRDRAQAVISKLLVADTGQLSEVIKEIDDDLGRTRLTLDRIAGDPNRSAKDRLHAGLALLPFEKAHDDYLFERLLGAEPDELRVFGERLRSRRSDFLYRLWATASDATTDRKHKLRAACALAMLDSGDTRWKVLAGDIAGSLVLDENAFRLERWLDALRPVRKSLLEPVAAIFRDRARPGDERFKATVILEQFAADDPEFLVTLIRDADLRQYKILMPVLRPHRDSVLESLIAELDRAPARGASDQAKNELARQQANCAVALLLLGRPHAVWSLLRESPEPRVRGFLIDRIERLGVDPSMIFDRLRDENDLSIRRALLLVLADYRGKGLPTADGESLETSLLEMFRTDPDSGIHSAAELVLRRCGHGNKVDALAKSLKSVKLNSGARWYVNSEGYTMVVIDPRGKDPALSCGRPVDRVFEMAAKEVSVEQYLRFRNKIEHNAEHSPTTSCPINCVSWYDASAYCRWLSEQEKVPPNQMCYPPTSDIKEGMRLPPDYLQRTGYRLPTEAEAEYACRAGTVTSRFFGSADSLLPAYAFFRDTSGNHSWAVGSLRPNDLGLFDILGNILEWCQESRSPVLKLMDVEDTEPVSNTIDRVLHGGSYEKVIELLQSDRSEHALPPVKFNSIGFRVARTHPSGR
ncbi:MAG TPA: protein kinase [Isosphaeraceae bacterium]|nr:protein kinase [Isosphaeraceae bacterium]